MTGDCELDPVAAVGDPAHTYGDLALFGGPAGSGVLAFAQRCYERNCGYKSIGRAAISVRSSPRKRGPVITGRCSWVPALAALGQDDDPVMRRTNLRL
jgi:hypothetical protein